MVNPGTDLAWGDVALDNHTNPRTVQFHLKKLKCDQFGKGADIVMGATDDKLCPVQAITRYMTMRGSNRSPFFQNAAGATVTKPWFVRGIRMWSPPVRLCRPQLQDWGSHNSGHGRGRIFYHPDPGSVAQRRLPALRQGTQRETGLTVINPRQTISLPLIDIVPYP